MDNHQGGRVREIVHVPSLSGVQEMFELSDIQYGDITCDVAEALCSQPGEYLIRRGITDNDFKLTIRQYSSYSHFTIYRERHPFSHCPFIYFLDDTTRKLLLADLAELVTHVISHPHSYVTPASIMNLQPCSRQKKRIIDTVQGRLIRRGSPINVNTTSSRRYFLGRYDSEKVVLMEKDNYLKVLDEIDVRAHLSHPNIVHYIGVTVVQPVYMVFPSEAQFNLHKYIKQLRQSKTHKMIRVCNDICSALIYLHSCGYIHRSIQSRACIVDRHGVSKILDLAKSCRSHSEFIEPAVGDVVLVPTRWAAPEVLKYSVFSKASDVWSFGIFIWEVFNKGETPYMNIINEASLITELQPGFRLSLKSKHISFDVLLENCLRYDVKTRPKLDTIRTLIQSLMS